jgi:hypothetical protein
MRILIALIAACILPSICNGAESNAFVADCSDFDIAVEEFVEGEGLTRGYIKSKAEFLCRRNGLPVNENARPFLYIHTTLVRLSNGAHVYNVRTSFSVSARGHNIEVWYTPNFTGYLNAGSSPTDAVLKQVQNDIESFYNVWMASHPKTPTKARP